jgi:predicted dehydrogenase
MVGVGIVGYGYWGPHLVRNFSEVEGCKVITVSDLQTERLNLISKRYPHVKVTPVFQDLLNDDSIDAIVVATPVSTHYDLTKQALNAGKHVLVEKPMAHSSASAQEMIRLAEHRNLTLQVDHTFVYTPAVEKIRLLISENILGDLYYYDSVRANLGLFRDDINVVWDLAVHDLSILDYVITEKPVSVSAIGISHIPNKPEDIAYITLHYQSSFIAHINVNWLSPIKVRKTMIGGSQNMIVYDDLEQSEKINIYDCGIIVNDNKLDSNKTSISYRKGEITTPLLNTTEALLTEAKHFIDCINHHKKPVTDGESGLRVVKILEAASLSMARKGEIISLENKDIS